MAFTVLLSRKQRRVIQHTTKRVSLLSMHGSEAGRVKTLHPGVHGGILAKRDDPSHLEALKKHKLSLIDVVSTFRCKTKECLTLGRPRGRVVACSDVSFIDVVQHPGNPD